MMYLSNYLFRFYAQVVKISFTAIVLATLIIILSVCLRNKLGPKFLYALFLILIIRLSFPNFPESKISIYNALPKGNDINLSTSFGYYDDKALWDLNLFREPRKSSILLNNNQAGISQGLNVKDSEQLFSAIKVKLLINIQFLLFIIWLSVVLLRSIQLIIANTILRLKINKEPNLKDKKLLELFQICMDKIQVHRKVELLKTDLVKQPSLHGIVHPTILIPNNISELLTYKEIEYVLMHELNHVKRRDLIANWFISAFSILHWFNPIVYFALQKMRENIEIACDFDTLYYLEKDERKHYGLTIIKLLERITKYNNSPMMASIIQNKSQTKRRISMIKVFDKKSRKISVIAIAVVLVLSSLFLTDAKAVVGSLVRPKDKIDYPFINDPDLIGTWSSVDFVKNISDFNPEKKSWKSDLYLQQMSFMENGTTPQAWFKWTKGHILHVGGDKTDSAYEIKDINGSKYLFMQWKSGDYIYAGRTPSYYVLKKVSTVPSEIGVKTMEPLMKDKIDYPFLNDPQLVGKWTTVTFVKDIQDFTPGKISWKGDLFFKEIEFLNDGTAADYTFIKWTKDHILFTGGEQTDNAYNIKEINGKRYLFMEFKNGDYVYRGEKPYYYVFQKANY